MSFPYLICGSFYRHLLPYSLSLPNFKSKPKLFNYSADDKCDIIFDASDPEKQMCAILLIVIEIISAKTHFSYSIYLCSLPFYSPLHMLCSFNFHLIYVCAECHRSIFLNATILVQYIKALINDFFVLARCSVCWCIIISIIDRHSHKRTYALFSEKFHFEKRSEQYNDY